VRPAVKTRAANYTNNNSNGHVTWLGGSTEDANGSFYLMYLHYFNGLGVLGGPETASQLANFYEALLIGIGDGLKTTVNTQLVQDILHMVAHCCLTNDQLTGDVIRTQSLGQKCQNLLLACSKSIWLGFLRNIRYDPVAIIALQLFSCCCQDTVNEELVVFLFCGIPKHMHDYPICVLIGGGIDEGGHIHPTSFARPGHCEYVAVG